MELSHEEGTRAVVWAGVGIILRSMNGASVHQALRLVPVASALSVFSLVLTLFNVLATRSREAENAAEGNDGANEAFTELVSEVVLVPANTALSHWYFWNVCTTNWADDSVLKSCLFTFCFFRMAAKLEAMLGHKGLAVFLVMGSTLTGLLGSCVMLSMLLVSDPDYFFETKLVGMAGVLVCAVLGNVRADPEDELLLFYPVGDGLLRVKARKALLPALCSYTFLALLLPSGWLQDAVLAWCGFVVGFYLLRNFEFNIEDGASLLYSNRVVYADDAFCLDAFFPDAARPVVRAVSSGLNAVVAKMFGCCSRKKKSSAQNHLGGLRVQNGGSTASGYQLLALAEQGKISGSSVSGGVTGPLVEKVNPVVDSRRARALKALDAKLAQMSIEPKVSLEGKSDVTHDNNGKAPELPAKVEETAPASATAPAPAPAKQDGELGNTV